MHKIALEILQRMMKKKEKRKHGRDRYTNFIKE